MLPIFFMFFTIIKFEFDYQFLFDATLLLSHIEFFWWLNFNYMFYFCTILSFMLLLFSISYKLKTIYFLLYFIFLFSKVEN